MRIFVTGGTGFIGGVVVRRLRERLEDVVALVRRPAAAAGLEGLGATLLEGDLDDAGALRRGVEGADAVIHGAAVFRVGIPKAERERVHTINVAGTERVLDAAIEAGVPRIVYVSTVNVFGNTHGRVVDEAYHRDLAAGFLSCYDQTKYLAHVAAEERIARGAPIIIVQPGGVYGPGDHSDIGSQIDKARQGKLPFLAFGSTGMVMVHVEDVAAGIVLALDKGALGRTYILGGEVTTLKRVVGTAAELAGKKPPRLTMPGWAVKAGIPFGPVLARVMDTEPNLRELVKAADGVTYWASDRRAREELGYAPRDLRTGLQELVAAAR
ncbi:MAG TPA: NAD-dependent epimerase/dehydratase family protein [Candidatus Dormibacteraeota bacterium]